MKRASRSLLLPLCLSVPCHAQDGEPSALPKLTITADPENVVAKKLFGAWKLDADLTARLGTKGRFATLRFERAESITAGIPAPVVAKLAKVQISAAGTVSFEREAHPFVLVAMNGNMQVVWFRERDGNPVGDAESFIVTLAAAKEAKDDILLVGGDRAKQPFFALVRDAGAVAKAEANAGSITTPEGAIADMLRLLNEKKHLELIQTYMSPADKERITAGKDSEGALELIAERFGKEKAGELAELLKLLQTKKPELGADGMTAHYDAPGGGRGLDLLKVGERWYIKN